MATIQRNKLPRNFGQMMKLLTEKDKQGYRHNYAYKASNGRTESTKELTFAEIAAIIKALSNETPEEQASDTMRKKIISMAREMGWEYWCIIKQKEVADMPRIKKWCVQYGYLHKDINKYTYAELPALVTQFEAVYTSFLSGII